MKAIIKQSLADELTAIERDIEKVKAQLKPLEEAEEKIRAKLLESMQKNHIKNVKLENGDTYIWATKSTFKVVDEPRAYQWAKENNALKVDTTAVAQIIKQKFVVYEDEDGVHTAPIGFEERVTDYLTIKRA